jgi:hypothetical protein
VPNRTNTNEDTWRITYGNKKNKYLHMKSVDFIIIGAGISGLSVARKLNSMGISYSILEHNEKAGGRIDTIEREGINLEFGAARILNCHERVMNLVNEFNLETEELKLNDAALFWENKWHISMNNFLQQYHYPDPLTIISELISEYNITSLQSFVKIAPKEWDNILTRDWLISKGVPKQYAKLYFLGDIDLDLEQISLYESAFFYVSNFSNNEHKIFRIKKGMSSLINLLINDFIPNIKFNTSVLEINKKEDLFNIVTNHGDYKARKIILTGSLNSIAKIKLPGEAEKKISELLSYGHYGKSLKGYVKLKTDPFPKTDYLISDIPIRLLRRNKNYWEIYLPSLFKNWSDEELKNLLYQYFGEENISDFRFKNFNQEPFYGCYWNYRLGYFHKITELCNSHELMDGIFSIGEHFSNYPNWIEGSLESVSFFFDNHFYKKDVNKL